MILAFALFLIVLGFIIPAGDQGALVGILGAAFIFALVLAHIIEKQNKP